MQTLRNKSIANLALYACFIAIAVLGYMESANFPKPLLPGYPGSALFPRFVMTLMAAFSIIGIGLELLRLSRVRASAPAANARDDDGGSGGISLLEFGVILVILAAAVAMIDWLGMEAGVFTFTAAMIYLVTRRPVASLIAGASTVLVVYLVFVQGLSVAMPLTFLPHYLKW